jgi:hypothetical protein
VAAVSAAAARSTGRWLSENGDDGLNDDDAENDEELTPLMAACRDEQLGLVKRLIRRNKASDRQLFVSITVFFFTFSRVPHN